MSAQTIPSFTGPVKPPEVRSAVTLLMPKCEIAWLDHMQETVAALPAQEDQFIDRLMAKVDRAKFVPAHYQL